MKVEARPSGAPIRREEPARPDAFLVVDARGAIESLNEAASRYLEMAAEAVIGRKIAEIFASPDFAELASVIAAVQAGVEAGRCGRIASPDHSVRWAASRLQRRRGVWAVAVTLQPNMPSDGDTLISLESYRDTFAHAIEGIFRTSLDGHYLEANQALANIYGFVSPAALIDVLRDLNTQLYVKEGRRAEFVRMIQREGYVADFESEVFRADGTRIWITEFARTVYDRAGQPLYFEGSVVDVTKRHFDAAALQESEEKFRALVESLNIVPWEAKLDTGQLFYVGPQAVRMLGYPIEDWFAPDFWPRHIHPEDREWVAIAKEEAFSKSERFELEYRFLRKDGEIIWVRDMLGVIHGKGDRRFVGGFLIDVTYHRYIEASLRESQYFFEHLVSAAPVIVYLYRLNGEECLYVNGQALEMLGFSKEALSQMKPFFILALGHPDELKEHESHFKSVAAERGNRVFEREFRLRGADGDWIWLRSRESIFERTPDGTPQQIVGIATDITLRRFALEELANDEHLFRSLVETTKVVPFEFSYSSKRLTYVGPQAEVLFGYPTKRWYTEGFGVSIVHPDDRKRIPLPFGDLDNALEADSDIQGEFRLRKGDGNYIWVRNVMRFGPDERSQGKGRGFLLDISEMKQREEESESSRRQLRELVLRNQNVREEERIHIARELHDELGQSLMLSRIDLEWLESTVTKSKDGDERGRLLRRIGEMSERTKATIETLRRIYTHLRPPILDELGLQAAIEWQAREFSRKVGIRCDVQVGDVEAPESEVATATFRIFQEVLTNIARHAAATSVKVKLEVVERKLRLVVRDNGRGFSTAPGSDAKGFGILGMNERTEALGGRIEIKSAPGEGTAIAVELPLSERSRLKGDGRAEG